MRTPAIMTYLEVNDDQDDDDCRYQVGDVWRVLPIECLLDSVKLIRLGQEEVEKRDDCSFEFGTLLCADGDG